MSTTTNSSTEALERKLLDIQALLMDADDDAGRLDADASWDVGLELLDARRAVTAALAALDKLTAPTIGPRWEPTVKHSPALDAIYAEVDTLFA